MVGFSFKIEITIKLTQFIQMGKGSLARKRAKELEKVQQEEEKNTEVHIIESDDDQYGDEYGDEDEKTPYTKEMARKHLSRIRETQDMYELIEISKVPDNQVRLKAIQQMCPCRVKDDITEFWERLFELAKDEDAKVRY